MKITLTGGFWKELYERNACVSVPAVQKQFENTGRFEALRFTHAEHPEAPLHVFYDSDVAKWMEAVAYLLREDRKRHAELEAFCDQLIDSMARHQAADGYLNSYFQQVKPEAIFTNRTDHELYCIGHLTEAAVAYDEATGKHTFLEVIRRALANVHRVFIAEQSAPFATAGHEEIKLALLRLYDYTGDRLYLEMADFFLRTRGNNQKDRGTLGDVVNEYYAQDDCPATAITEANGHAVRALYYYTAIAMLAKREGDVALLEVARGLYQSITEKKMYITGGVGSTRIGECFATAYTLPNSTAYSESCAAIAFLFFCRALLDQDHKATYSDTVERLLYNGVLSSTSLDGSRFFYENPLEINLDERGTETSIYPQHRQCFPPAERAEVFWCSCCPPNINRTMASIDRYIYTATTDTLYVEQYIASRCEEAGVEIITDFPYSDAVTVKGTGFARRRLAIRVPAWCRQFSFDREYRMEDGYAVFDVDADFTIQASFRREARFVHASSRVHANAGRVALQYGPIVYCLEGVDNGGTLTNLAVDVTAPVVVTDGGFQPLPRLVCSGVRTEAGPELYSPEEPVRTPIQLTYIPYHAFANRGPQNMQVWVLRA